MAKVNLSRLVVTSIGLLICVIAFQNCSDVKFRKQLEPLVAAEDTTADEPAVVPPVVKVAKEVPPSILVPPDASTAVKGQDFALNVIAEGDEPLLYRWYKGDVLLDAQFSSGYTFPVALENADEGLYRVEVSNPHGIAISETEIKFPVPAIPCGSAAKIRSVAANGTVTCKDNSTAAMKAANAKFIGTCGNGGCGCLSGTYDWRCEGVHYTAYTCGSSTGYNAVCKIKFDYDDGSVTTLTQCASIGLVVSQRANYCTW